MNSLGSYRKSAKENLSGKWGEAVFVCILFTLLLSLSSVLMFIFAGPLLVGLAYYFRELTIKKDAGAGALLHGSSKKFGKAFGVFILKNIFLSLWTMLLVIPGLIKSYSYAMAEYVLIRKNVSANEAITISREVMNGNKWKLFWLRFSFIGWSILCLFTLGIGYLWLIPYEKATEISFFEDAYNKHFKISEAKAKTESSI